jgi:hypothetical protein
MPHHLIPSFNVALSGDAKVVLGEFRLVRFHGDEQEDGGNSSKRTPLT